MKALAVILSLILGISCLLTADAASVEPSFVLIDPKTRSVLISENSRLRISPAALTKLMTALLVAEAIDRGELDGESVVTASSLAFSEPGARIWLNTGEKISVNELLAGLLIGNANDAAIALSEAVGGTTSGFVDMMNERAEQLGMASTRFVNPTGAYDESQYSTAEDIALLACVASEHEILIGFTSTFRSFVRGGATELVNTNRLVLNLDGADGLKASLSSESGAALALSVTRNGRRLIAVCIGYADEDSCADKAKKLVTSGFSTFGSSYPISVATLLKPLSVHSGSSDSVRISADLELITAEKSALKDLCCIPALPKWLDAPVRNGQIVGSIGVYSDQTLLCEIPVYACEDVKRRTLADVLSRLLASLSYHSNSRFFHRNYT